MKQFALILALMTWLIEISVGQTNVSGGIYLDTTWTKSGSPYIVTDNIVVFPAVTLTIEPGVEVRFDRSKKMELRGGSLIAEGKVNDSIVFTANTNELVKYYWYGINASSSDSLHMSYSRFEHAHDAIDGVGTSTKGSIRNSLFYTNEVGIENTSDLPIDSCVLIGNYVGIDAGPSTIIESCQFTNNEIGVRNSGSVLNSFFCQNGSGISTNQREGTVSNCVFVNNNIGYSGQFVNTMVGCVFYYNEIGISSSLTGTAGYNVADTMINNIIMRNEVGWAVRKIEPGSYQNGNNICNNKMYNVELRDQTSLSLKNVCWCETDSSKIASLIYDGYDDIQRGLLTFGPIDDCSNRIFPEEPKNDCYGVLAGINPQMDDQTPSILCFPIPARDQLTVELDETIKGEILVTGIDGRIIDRIAIDKSNKVITLKTDHWLEGFFILTVLNEGMKIGSAKGVILR